MKKIIILILHLYVGEQTLAMDGALTHALVTLGGPTSAAEADVKYKNKIRRLMPFVMKQNPDPDAVELVRSLGEARKTVLTHFREIECTRSLASVGEQTESQRLFAKQFLEDDLSPFLPNMAAQPTDTLSQLLNHKGQNKIEEDSEIWRVAEHIGRYLRLNSLENPFLLANFEKEIIARIAISSSDPKTMTKLLHIVGGFNLAPGATISQVIELLDHDSSDVREAAAGVLFHTSARYGWPPPFETQLLRIKNEVALRFLINSNKIASANVRDQIMDRLTLLRDHEVLKAVVQHMFQFQDRHRALYADLIQIRDDASNTRLNRYVASEILIERGFERTKTIATLVSLVPSSVGAEILQITSWCINSPRHCPPSLRTAVDSIRVPQRHWGH